MTFAGNLSSEYGDEITTNDIDIIYDIEITGVKMNWAIIKMFRKNPTQTDIRLMISILRETLELYSMYREHDTYCMKIINMLLTVRSHIFLKSMVTVIRLEYYNEYEKLMQHILLNRMNMYHNANNTKKNTIYIDIEYLFSVSSKNVISGAIVEFIRDDDIKYIHTLEELLDDYFDDYIDSIINQIVFNGANVLFTYMHNKYGPFTDLNRLVSIYIDSLKTINISTNILVTMKELGYIMETHIEDCALWVAGNSHIINNSLYHIESLIDNSKDKKLPYMVFANVVVSNNYILFQKIAYKYFNHLSNVRLFCLISRWVPNVLTNEIMTMYFENTQFNINEKDDIFIKICMNNDINVARWIVCMNPYRYYIGVENGRLMWFDINYDMTLPPIIYDNMKPNYVETMGECTVCYEEVDNYIVLPCHDTHITCVSCFIRMINNMSCPMCRANYHISYCKLQLTQNKMATDTIILS